MLYCILRKEVMPSKKMYLQTCLSFIMIFLLGFLVCVYWNYTKAETRGHDIVFSGNHAESFGDWQVIDRGDEFLSALENTAGLKAYGILMSPITKNVEALYVVVCSEQFFEDNLSPYIVSGANDYGENIIWLGKVFAVLAGLEVGDTVDGEDADLTVGAIVDTFDGRYNKAMFFCLDDNLYNKIVINFDAKGGKENYYSVMHRFNNGLTLNGYAEEPYREKEEAMNRMMLVGFSLCAFAFFFEVLPVAYLFKGQKRKMAILNALGYRREKIIKVYFRLIYKQFLVSCLLSNLLVVLVIGLTKKVKFEGIIRYAAYGKEFILFQVMAAAALLLMTMLVLTALTRNSLKTYL